MGLVIRQSISNSIISYAGVAIGYVNLLYLYPRILEPEQIGTLRTLQDAALLFSPFAQFGVVQSIQRYFPQFGKDTKASGSFISLMLTMALAGFGIFFLAFLAFQSQAVSYFQPRAGDFVQFLPLTLWLTLILVITSVLESYSRALLKTVVPNLLRELVVRTLLGAFVLLYFGGYFTFDQFILSTLGAYLVCLVALIIYLLQTGYFQLTFRWPKLEGSLRKEMVRYGLFGFAGTAGMIIIGKVDSLMVAGLMGLAANAVYTTAFYMATVIEIPKRALVQVTMPLIARAFETNDMTEIRNLYRKTALNQFIVGLLLLLGVVANLDNLFALMPNGSVYAAGFTVVIIVGVGKLADMFFGPSSEIIVLSRYYAFNIVLLVLLAVMTIALNTILIPAYGITGAAWSAAVSLVLFNTVKFIFIWWKLGLQPFSGKFLTVLVIGTVTWTASVLLPRMDQVLIDMVVRSVMMTLIFGLLILGLKVSEEVNGAVKRMRGRW